MIAWIPTKWPAPAAVSQSTGCQTIQEVNERILSTSFMTSKQSALKSPPDKVQQQGSLMHHTPSLLAIVKESS